MSGERLRRALIVDFGGVLTTNVFESFRDFCEAEGLDPDAVKRIFRERGEGLDLLRQLERGEIEVEEFSRRFGPLLGVRETDGMVERLFAGVQADERMVEAVRRVKESGRPTGLISNSWGGVSYDRVATDDLFDAIVSSAEEGMAKPEPAIYRLAAERLAVPPAACVFVDDFAPNVEAANAVGMRGILFYIDRGHDLRAMLADLGLAITPADPA